MTALTLKQLTIKAKKLHEEGKCEEAITYYNYILSKNQDNVDLYIAKSMSEQKLKKYDAALSTLAAAKKLVIETEGSDEETKNKEIGKILYRCSAIKMNQGDFQESVKFINAAKAIGHGPACDLWLYQLKNKAAKQGIENIDFDATFTEGEMPEFTPAVIDKNAPLPEGVTLKKDMFPPPLESSKPLEFTTPKPTVADEKKALEQKIFPKPNEVRVDWFQSDKEVTVSVFVKNAPKDKVSVEYHPHEVEFEFPTSASSDFMYTIGPLFANIDPTQSSHRVFGTKIEFYLAKASNLKWKDLKRASGEKAAVGTSFEKDSEVTGALKYPNSSKKGTDWAHFQIEDDEEDKEGEGEDAFFKKLYADADDDTKRAMMKSYVESGGTALSTNWGEVGTKDYKKVAEDLDKGKTGDDDDITKKYEKDMPQGSFRKFKNMNINGENRLSEVHSDDED